MECSKKDAMLDRSSDISERKNLKDLQQTPTRPLANKKIMRAAKEDLLFSYCVLPGDVDQFKHMSFANYVKLMFDASDTLFVKNLGNNFQEQWMPKLKYASLQFKKQTQTGDRIAILPKVRKLGDKIALENHYIINHEKDDEDIAATGLMIFDFVSLGGKKPSFSDLVIQLSKGINFENGAVSEAVEINVFQKQQAANIYLYDAIKVYFKHTDYYGNLHHYYFFEWTSHVRESFFSEKCKDFQGILKSNIAMMTTKIELEVFDESQFSDEIIAQLSAQKVKKVSCDLIINFFNKRLNKVVATTKHALVFADQKTHKFCLIPDSLKPAMLEYSEP